MSVALQVAIALYASIRHTHMHMRTTLILDDKLLSRAKELTGIAEKTALVHEGLKALIAREAGKRLAALGGTEPDLRPIPRRRPT